MSIQRLLSIKDFSRLYGPGKSTTYELIKAGELQIVKVGARSFIPIECAEAWRQRRIEAAGICVGSAEDATSEPRPIGDILASAITSTVEDPAARNSLLAVVSALPSAPSTSHFSVLGVQHDRVE